MSEDNDRNDNLNPPNEPSEPDEPQVQRLRQNSVSARVTDDVAAGVFCTGALVIRGKDEFTIDFVQAVRRPPRVVARVVMSPRVMGEFVEAARKNLDKFEEQFGPPKPLPRPPGQIPPVDKIYEDMRIPDELLPGRYANVVMIGHTPGEFMIDFITQFYPRSAVSARVYMSAANMPGLIRTLATASTHDAPPPEPPPDGGDGMYP